MAENIPPCLAGGGERRKRFPADRRIGISSVESSRREIATTKYIAWITVLAWTILSVLSFRFQFQDRQEQTIRLARTEAVTQLDSETVLRNWIAAHGGVYVKPDASTPPNPYLAHIPEQNVVTTDGVRLTLINTSYLMRLLHASDKESQDKKVHISSLRPINPANVPETWEKAGFAAFAAGTMEYAGVFAANDRQYYTVTRVLKAGAECRKCHKDPDLKDGDTLGFLSARVDLSPYLELEHNDVVVEAINHGAIWLIGFLGIITAFRVNLGRVRERQRTQEALRESQHLFQTMADYSSDWIFWRNPDGRFRYVSPACEAISGYSSEDFYADPELFLKLVHPEDKEAFAAHLTDALRATGAGFQEVRILRRDGQVRYLAHACRPIYDGEGRFIGVRGANHDITRLRENEQILINQSRLAAMGEMISNIAHQWRQPISAVGLILQNLKYDYDEGRLTSADLHDYVARGRELVTRMSTTIDDFRSFFRPEHDPSVFDIHQPIRDAIQIVQDSFRAHGIEISWPEDGPQRVAGYPNELAQVILNLLANAKDAIVERAIQKGRVEVRVSAAAKELLLTVRDNGGGIPKEVLPRIFDPYFTTKANGTGIGLYMSATIIGHMGGSIAAKNIDGGAEFTLKLPLGHLPEPPSPGAGGGP